MLKGELPCSHILSLEEGAAPTHLKRKGFSSAATTCRPVILLTMGRSICGRCSRSITIFPASRACVEGACFGGQGGD